jgi:hypothetical protein
MAISCWDKFTAIDWTTPAAWVARLTLVVLVICAVITWFTYEDYEDKYNNNKDALIGVSVYCVFIAFIMVILETPLFHCFGAISRAKEHWLLSPFAKGMYYWLSAILTFVYISPNIAGGAFLLLTSIFEFMAQCQQSQDAADQKTMSRASGRSNMNQSLV